MPLIESSEMKGASKLAFATLEFQSENANFERANPRANLFGMLN